MSVEQLTAAIRGLSDDERRRLMRWFDDHRHELVDAAQTAIERDQEAEIRARGMEADVEASGVHDCEDPDLERMTREFIHARAKNSPSGPG